MQNLTARYNILYNAREILKESEQNISLSHQDNYDVLLDVYEEPNEQISQPELKKLDEAILKANSIINDKVQSKYVDDAYFIIAKANFLKSNFYNATEFFTYIYGSYPKQTELRQLSLVFKARSLINSERFNDAKSVLDTAFKYVNTKSKSVAGLYATSAQLALYGHQDERAAEMLEKAVSFSGKGQHKIRWIFLLAQLQELNGNLTAAQKNYAQVIKSNAPFEMAFNATLNRLSIKDKQEGRSLNRDEQLLSLLKDDNNVSFSDQVYFEIAKLHADKGELEVALKNYKTSLRKSSGNDNQKGLAYRAIGDIYFKQKKYEQSKAFYDSSLASLSPQHRDFDLIRKKAGSMSLLSDRLLIIDREDTLQMLAKLPEAERKKRIDLLAINQAQNFSGQTTNPSTSLVQQTALQNTSSDKFYFNNRVALSQGLAEFKRIWGNRKLEDNWRRSQRSAIDIANSNLNGFGLNAADNPDVASIDSLNTKTSLNTGILPETPELMEASNGRIIAAYYDIGNYYREELNDEEEAIKTYELMLNRFPENNLKLPVYYNLYRLYAMKDPKKSLEYKNILLNQFPESPFAKVINNPEYNRMSDDKELELNNRYNELYDQYVAKNYPEVLKQAEEINQKYNDNKLSPQLAYLRALAIGHTQKLNVLDSVFRNIVRDYSADILIVPLIKQHLAYIDSNKLAMQSRTFALVDQDPNEEVFVEEPAIEPVLKSALVSTTPADNKQVDNNIITATENKTTVPAGSSPVENGLFSMTESAEYYYIINVMDPSVNLSSSRFGVGQFNRANFSGEGIKHQLKSVNNQNQLIFVGVFKSNQSALDYSLSINQVMKEIMKIPVDKYNTFYISKQNLEKLSDRLMINKYLEFYRLNLNLGQ
ncbi:MAG: tetratricopeptide repeat protein [Flavobacterium sp.]|nr:tetratricopeptide repeat protein [Pedobacter sp.]